MSTETQPPTSPKRKIVDYPHTLAAPHASKPTMIQRPDVYDIGRGPKRVRLVHVYDATKEIRLVLPPHETWTIDTLRMTLWQLACFLPGDGGSAGNWGEMERFVKERNVMAEVSVRVYRRSKTYLHLTVELPKAGVSIYFDSSEWPKFSEPMRAALTGMPTQPFPLAAIARPEDQPAGEREEKLDDVRSLQRMADTLKELAYLKPKVFREYVALLKLARETYVDDDDEEGGA